MNDPSIGSWRDLLVWSKAHEAVLAVYSVTQQFPVEEKYRLTDQLCRAAASVPTNIAEGKGRSTSAEFGRFLTIARGSTEETRYLLMLAHDLKLLPTPAHAELQERYTEISKMLNGLIRSLRR